MTLGGQDEKVAQVGGVAVQEVQVLERFCTWTMTQTRVLSLPPSRRDVQACGLTVRQCDDLCLHGQPQHGSSLMSMLIC